MEALFALCSLFGTVVGMVAFVGVLVWWGQHQAKVQRQRFAQAAQQLGLTLAGDHAAHGSRDDVGVRVVLTTESRGSGKNRRQVRVTRYFAHPDPPLRMGLAVSEQTAFFGELLDFAGLSNDITLGDAALDSALRIRALEPDHARAVLLDAGIGPAILAACAAGRFSLDDNGAALQHDGWAVHAHEIQRRLDPLHAVARGIAAARRRWRAGWEHALDASWGGLALTESLTYDPSRTQLYGRIGDTTIQVAVVTEKGTLVTRAEARFDPPLGLGMQVYRTGVAQNLGKLFGAQDVQVGVPEFDVLFTVKASDEAGVRRVLGDGGGAHAILKMASIAADVSADDQAIRASVGGVVGDPRAVAGLVRAMSEAARAVRGGGAVAAGAYR